VTLSEYQLVGTDIMTLSKYQLERADLTVTIEQGRRVEGELFAENHRNLQTMGELLKARMFGATEYAINLRKRMTKFQGGRGNTGPGPLQATSPPESHSWPCDDPFCQPCEDGVKRLLRDVGVLPRKGRAR
jgi:hypothetical protein